MTIIGIDLGTTTSEACVYRDKKPVMIRSVQNKDIIDSVVGIDPKTRQVICGEKAKSLYLEHPDKFVVEVKRTMGEPEVKHKMGDKELTPEEVSALLLKYIKGYAEDYLGEKVERAVITVPANFNDSQRNATKKAGELAGFKVERLINEPTAAALAYGYDKSEYNENVMIYDLGGGTFDVSILEYHDNILDVKASVGDNKLGGKDFDRCLRDYVAQQFLDEQGIDLRQDLTANNRLTQECEKAKKELSFAQETAIILPFITVKDGKPLGLDIRITRSTLENLIREKIDKTEEAIKKALKDSNLEKDDINTVLLVGGSTRIPYVNQVVKRVLGKEPKLDIDPDRAVAMGAAIQSGIIDDATGENGAVIMDVVPLSLGVSVVSEYGGRLVDGIYSEIIPRNAPYLKEYKETYNTMYDNQDSVDVEVYQKDSLNDSMWVVDHTLIGAHKIGGIPPNLAGKESLTITFLHNLDGVLEVTVTIDSTGEENPFKVNTQASEDISPDNLDAIWQESELAEKVKSTIMITEKKLPSMGDQAIKTELEDLILNLKKAVVEGNEVVITELDDKINDLLFDIEDI